MDKELPQLDSDAADKPLAGDASDKSLTGNASDKPLADDTPDKPLADDGPDKPLAGDASDKSLADDAPDTSLADTVQADLNAYLTRLEQRSDLNDTLLTFRTHLRNLTNRYAPGLFHCYDIPGLPRTNNDTESLFGRVRRQTNRTSGAYHAKQRLQEQGAWLLFDLPNDEIAQLRRLKRVSLHEWRNERKRMQAHLDSFRHDRRFRTKPAAYLAKLETQAADIASSNLNSTT